MGQSDNFESFNKTAKALKELEKVVKELPKRNFTEEQIFKLEKESYEQIIHRIHETIYNGHLKKDFFNDIRSKVYKEVLSHVLSYKNKWFEREVLPKIEKDRVFFINGMRTKCSTTLDALETYKNYIEDQDEIKQDKPRSHRHIRSGYPELAKSDAYRLCLSMLKKHVGLTDIDKLIEYLS